MIQAIEFHVILLSVANNQSERQIMLDAEYVVQQEKTES